MYFAICEKKFSLILLLGKPKIGERTEKEDFVIWFIGFFAILYNIRRQ